jgi:hypothetical protein
MHSFLELIFLILFGWCGFLLEVIPAVSFYWPTFINGVVSFLVLLLGMHSTILWCIRQGLLKPGWPALKQWKLRWSLLSVLLIVTAFVAGMAITALGHQIFWLWRELSLWGFA